MNLEGKQTLELIGISSKIIFLKLWNKSQTFWKIVVAVSLIFFCRYRMHESI